MHSKRCHGFLHWSGDGRDPWYPLQQNTVSHHNCSRGWCCIRDCISYCDCFCGDVETKKKKEPFWRINMEHEFSNKSKGYSSREDNSSREDDTIQEAATRPEAYIFWEANPTSEANPQASRKASSASPQKPNIRSTDHSFSSGDHKTSSGSGNGRSRDPQSLHPEKG